MPTFPPHRHSLRQSAKKWRREFRRLRPTGGSGARQKPVDLRREFHSACEHGKYTVMQFYEFLKANEDAANGGAESAAIAGGRGWAGGWIH